MELLALIPKSDLNSFFVPVSLVLLAGLVIAIVLSVIFKADKDGKDGKNDDKHGK